MAEVLLSSPVTSSSTHTVLGILLKEQTPSHPAVSPPFCLHVFPYCCSGLLLKPPLSLAFSVSVFDHSSLTLSDLEIAFYLSVYNIAHYIVILNLWLFPMSSECFQSKGYGLSGLFPSVGT